MKIYNQYKKSNIVLLFGIVLLLFFFNTSFSQEKSILDSNITFKAKNELINEILTSIGKRVGYEFSYNSDLIPANSEISVNQTKGNLTDLLNKILGDSTLAYKVADKQIIITKKNLINNLTFVKSESSLIDFINITGVIHDKATKSLLPFANISVKNKSIGTISNEFGEFNLNISNSFLFDTIVFSYMGYKNTYIPVNQLSICKNQIYLAQDNFTIAEVIIRGYDAKEILQSALNEIKNNYFTDPYLITAFYREMVMKKTDLASVTESVLDIYKSPYLGSFSDQIKLIKSRKNEYYSDKDTVALKLKGGLYASLYLDLIKNPSFFLQDQYFSYYNYSMDEIINYDNRSVYVINFSPKYYLEENSFQGKIFIDMDNLSIVSVEFNIEPKALEKIGRDLIIKKSFGTQVKPESAKYVVNYRKINNLYFLSFVRGELDFKVKYKKKLFFHDFKTVFELVSNEIDTVNVERFKRSEVITSDKIFIDENYDYDGQFWGEYNYISPEVTLQESLIEIQKKIDKLNSIEKDK